jgi:hypothetical protein
MKRAQVTQEGLGMCQTRRWWKGHELSPRKTILDEFPIQSHFYDELNINSKDEKLSEELEKQSKAHLASREKMETTANALDPEILAARNELNDEIDCGNRDKA